MNRKNIIAFAGSNSKKSINKKLVQYASSQLSNIEVEVLDLNDYPLPLFGVDYEAEFGIPDNASKFLNRIQSSDGIIVSLAEHNGAYSTAFKNIFDWMSRIDGKIWNNKPMLLMAAAPGSRGGKSVLEIAANKFPRMHADLVGIFSFPHFNQNFIDGRIVNEHLNAQLNKLLVLFKNNL